MFQTGTACVVVIEKLLLSVCLSLSGRAYMHTIAARSVELILSLIEYFYVVIYACMHSARRASIIK